MDPLGLAISIRGETLLLLPERALFWPARGRLIVADIHFGKSATFRRHGMPVPEGDTKADLERLDKLARKTGARQLVIAGDLLHAAAGKSAQVREAVSLWRHRHSELEIVLVSGNHDKAAGPVPDEWGIEVAGDRMEDAPFAIVHDPADTIDNGSFFHICGHLHPAVALADGKMRPLRAPCFWRRRDALVLPGFGAFTGSKTIHPAPGDAVYALAGEAVVAIPPALLAKR